MDYLCACCSPYIVILKVDSASLKIIRFQCPASAIWHFIQRYYIYLVSLTSSLLTLFLHKLLLEELAVR